MSENNYGALMMKSALPTSQDLKSVVAPGCYPVIAGNPTAPGKLAGSLRVLPTTGTANLLFSANDGNTYKPTPTGWIAFGETKSVNGHQPDSSGAVAVTSQDIFDGQAVYLGESADLNNYTTPGLYFQPANANAITGKNYPEPNAGSLEIYKHAGVTQVYRIYNSSRSYVRTLYSGAWSGWVRQYDKDNPPTAQETGAVPVSGGNVDYLDNSKHYATKKGVWEGGGSFSEQLKDPRAPFVIPIMSAPAGESTYLPMIKSIVQTQGLGYQLAASLGVLKTGGADFGLAVIHLIGDNGSSCAWFFDPTTGSFRSDKAGYFSTQTDAQTRADKAYNDAIAWVKSQFSLNFTASGWWHRDITGKITQGGTVIGNGGYVTTNFPVVFPNKCLGVQMTLANGDFNNSKDNIFVTLTTNNAFQALMHSSEYGANWIAEGY